MERNNFYDTETSALPSISLTFEKSKQKFSKKLSEVVVEKEPKFEFWITIIWKDETEKPNDDEKNLYFSYLKRMDEFKIYSRETLSLNERRNITIERTEKLLQNLMWQSVERLKEK